jgi:DNA-binding Lrp family transcriptional regulator
MPPPIPSTPRPGNAAPAQAGGGPPDPGQPILLKQVTGAAYRAIHGFGNARMPRMKLDKIDIRILSELQKNGRITNVELADLVHLSPSPCLMRVKRLQAEGFITGYSAQIDIAKLGQSLTVFTEITLRNHRHIDFARFLSAIEKIDSVIECHLVSGGYDYLVKFITSGVSEYQAIMESLLDREIGIDKYFTFVILKSPIVKAHLPLDAIASGD